MAIKFNQFTTGDVSNTGSADYLVGYDSTQDGVAGGEKVDRCNHCKCSERCDDTRVKLCFL